MSSNRGRCLLNKWLAKQSGSIGFFLFIISLFDDTSSVHKLNSLITISARTWMESEHVQTTPRNVAKQTENRSLTVFFINLLCFFHFRYLHWLRLMITTGSVKAFHTSIHYRCKLSNCKFEKGNFFIFSSPKSVSNDRGATSWLHDFFSTTHRQRLAIRPPYLIAFWQQGHKLIDITQKSLETTETNFR